MHFERSLKRSVFPAWSDKYIDYSKLKALLHELGSDAGSINGDDEWTEKDEEAFVDELINRQLEKVHSFQLEKLQDLRDRTGECEARLDTVATQGKSKAGDNNDDDKTSGKLTADEENLLKETEGKLDAITKEMNELEKYSRINYTGFLKAAKKHDRRRGTSYHVGPILQVRLSELPFNKEDYSPLLFRISTMFSFCRQESGAPGKPRAASEYSMAVDHYTVHKYWVHPDNLLELKTVLARHLPLLVYNPQDSKIAEGGQSDPTITSVYFDNPQFALYNAKASHSLPATSLRLRWYGDLSSNPEIFVEKKTVFDDDSSTEQRFTTRSRNIQGFLKGQNHMEREVERLVDRVGEDSQQVTSLKEQIADIQKDILEKDLQPVVRANYTRAAFQIPGDNRVRITLDTNLALIREDALDSARPCRDPEDWHRKDIDDNEMDFPFTAIRTGEINRFPFAVLEIRTNGAKEPEWVRDLTTSHLVKSAARFSKFIHGTAQLFDEYVNTFPFWLGQVDTDIRIDPHQAFEVEQQRKAQVAEDEVAVGSLLGPGFSKSITGATKQSVLSPVGSPASSRAMTQSATDRHATAKSTRRKQNQTATGVHEDSGSDTNAAVLTQKPGIRSYLPSLSMSKYAQAKRNKMNGTVDLPEGVKEPTYWIKDEGEVKVEAKVWLANQRTFIKWQHVAILLASLSLGLFNAAGKDNNIARALGAAYTVLAIFIAVWGWAIYMYRANLIQKRSGKDFDNILGPCIACIGLIVALCLNFGFKYNALITSERGVDRSQASLMAQPINGSL